MFEEIKQLVINNCEEFDKDLYEILIRTFACYLSYQNNALNVFHLSQAYNDELIAIFGKLFDTFCECCEIENQEQFINELLPDQPIATQYIWSLKQ